MVQGRLMARTVDGLREYLALALLTLVWMPVGPVLD